MKKQLYSIATILLLSLSYTPSQCMHLTFNSLCSELGQAHGEREAKALLTAKPDSKTLLHPLFTQLERTLNHMQNNSEARSQFEGFIKGFTLTLCAFSARQRHYRGIPLFSFDAAQFKTRVDELKQKEDNKTAQKNREELVKLLTAQLIDMKLLILN